MKRVDRTGTHSEKFELLKERFGREDLLALWVADMDFAVAKEIEQTMTNRAKHPVYGYTKFPDSYYNSIANWLDKRFNFKIDKSSIVPAFGVVTSINIALKAFSNEGDKIIIQTPIYPPFFGSVKRNNREVLDNKLIYKDGKYSIDFDDFREKAKEAKMFLLCSPHNPSTRVWSKDELEKLVSICKEESVIIVSDEIHSDITFEKHYPLPVINGAKDITIYLHSPSKTFNIAGLNGSYAVIQNDTLKNAYEQEQLKCGLNEGNIFAIESQITAYKECAYWVDELKEYLLENKQFVVEFLKDNIPQIKPIDSEATFLIWLDCKELNLEQKELEDIFINQAKLALNSGVSFGENGESFMRLNIGTSKEILKEALIRLKNIF